MALAASRGEDRLAFLQAMKGVSARLGLSLDAQAVGEGQDGTHIAPLGTEDHLHLVRCGGASHHGASQSRKLFSAAGRKRTLRKAKESSLFLSMPRPLCGQIHQDMLVKGK